MRLQKPIAKLHKNEQHITVQQMRKRTSRKKSTKSGSKKTTAKRGAKKCTTKQKSNLLFA